MKNSILFAPLHRFAGSSRAFLFLLALMGASTTTAMAAIATLGTQSSQYTNSNTLAYTVNAGTDRLLVVALGDPNTATNPTAVTYNGTSMLQANATADLGFSNDAIWYLKLGTGGAITSNIVVTFAAAGNAGSSRFIGASAYSGVDQTTPVDINGPKISGSVTTTGSSLNVTSQTGDLVFDLFDSYKTASQTAVTTGAGQTRINEAGGLITPTGGNGHYVTSTEAGAATVTMSWTGDSEAVLHLTMNINAGAVDTTPPTAIAVNRQPLTTLAVSGSSTVFRVTFSETVTGVDTSDFTLFKIGTVNGTVASISGSGAVYDVTVNSITGFGSLRLDLKHSGTGIVDGASNALADGYDNGQVVRVGTTVPIGWGNHTVGQIGDGTAVGGNKIFPTAVDTSGVLSGKNIVQMASGANWTLVLTADNQLYAWGNNNVGQLGTATASLALSTVPVAVPMTGVLSGKTIVKIACGDAFSMVLDSDGKLYAWGVGTSGQLGDGLSTTGFAAVAVSTSTGLSGKVVTDMSGGSAFAIACTSDGGIYTWGNPGNGRLGNGTTTGNVTMPAQLGGVFTGKRVIAVSGGGSFGAALTSDGRVYSWGNNTAGQLGDGGGTIGTPTNNPTPAGILGTGLLPGSRTIANITCTFSGMYAIARDGTLYSWGAGTLGGLGNGGTTTSTSPVLVDTTGVLSGKTIAAINGGNNFAEVITTEGKAYSWGTNASGQLGDGTTTQRNNPIAVDVSAANSALNGKTLSFLSQSGQGTFTMMAVNAAVPDTTPPTVVSIVRQTPTSQATSSTSATFRVTFSEAVNAPAASNFAIAAVSSSITGSIGTVTAVNASTYDVPVTITGGSGEFRLKVQD